MIIDHPSTCSSCFPEEDEDEVYEVEDEDEEDLDTTGKCFC